ncbi:MAG: peptidoglycan DD-metalloendopeptidase family protein [Chlorobiaceae bacterium]
MLQSIVAAPRVNNEISRIMKERAAVEQNLMGLKRQLKEYQFKLSSTKKEESISLRSLENIRRQILVLEKIIAENQSYLNRLNLDIDRLQSELQGNRQAYNRISDDFRRTVVFVYKYGINRDVEHLFASGSVNDALVRSQYMGFFTRAVRQNVNNLQEAAVQLENNRLTLEQTYKQKAEMVKEQESQLKTWATSKKEKEMILVQLKKNKQEYAAQLRTVQKKRQQLQSRIESLILAEQHFLEAEQERRRKILEAKRFKAKRMAGKKEKVVGPSQVPLSKPLKESPVLGKNEVRKPESSVQKVPEAKSVKEVTEAISPELEKVSIDFDHSFGSLPWPVLNGIVSQKFGSVEDKELKIVTTNNGIDISVPVNTPVRAVSGGKVAQISFLPTFGNIVIIRHPNSYLTVYANLGQLNVVKDDLIKSQQLVGLSGRMSEGGSVVHFEIWKGRVKQNPEKWLKR